MAKVPVSLIIDDGSPVNLYYFHDLMREHELIVPIEQVLRFASICKKNGVRGKFSVVPMPCNLGRLDKGLSHCPWEHVQQFIKAVRENVAPMFSLTPEIISHYWAFDVKTERVLDVREDIYFSTLTAEQIADYVSYAIKILCNVDLIPEGVTSPWMTGIDNEQNYAEGIGMAFKRTLNKDRTFYFLHNQSTIKAPIVMCNSAETGKVVSIPRDFPDVFWPGNNPGNDAEAKRKIKEGIDSIISEDGRSGQFVNLLNAERPLVFIAHWQSLFSDGRFYGLDGFEVLMERVTRYFGDQVEWLTFKEIAERY
ncbi:MAG: hypothetical protein IKS92_01250 [Victivallales bacterium]|nr:hypothetical protein [Victivallales bacterium]